MMIMGWLIFKHRGWRGAPSQRKLTGSRPASARKIPLCGAVILRLKVVRFPTLPRLAGHLAHHDRRLWPMP
jgi:hypothetical protein